jgi:DNA-binding NarL/FixJ family response regulator
MDHYLSIPLSQLLSLPQVQSSTAAMNLGSTAPTAPMFVYHAVHDEVVPIGGVDATVRSYCAKGSKVTYIRDETAEHVSLAFVGEAIALKWLVDQLDGALAPTSSSTTTVPSMALTPSVLQAVPPYLLNILLGLLDQPVGKQLPS